MLYQLPSAETGSLLVFLSLAFYLASPIKSLGMSNKFSLDWAGLSRGGGDLDIQVKPFIALCRLGHPSHCGMTSESTTLHY